MLIKLTSALLEDWSCLDGSIFLFKGAECLQRGMDITSVPEGDSRIARVSLTGTQYQIGYRLNESIEKIIEITGVKKV